jgi:hypothetical protein
MVRDDLVELDVLYKNASGNFFSVLHGSGDIEL